MQIMSKEEFAKWLCEGICKIDASKIHPKWSFLDGVEVTANVPGYNPNIDEYSYSYANIRRVDGKDWPTTNTKETSIQIEALSK